jgi:hypothetical protein
MAEKIANVVYKSASEIAARKWWADFSFWRRKWIWAIRKIIRQVRCFIDRKVGGLECFVLCFICLIC